MKKFDVVVIGGGPAGLQTAISARNSNDGITIALIRKEEKVLIPCGIPYITHSLNSVDENILPDAPLHNNDIEIIVGEVVDFGAYSLELKSGETVQYKKLVLATGSLPVEPPVAGFDKQGVFTVKKDYDYQKAMKEESAKAEKVIIVGGGYIGIELVDEFAKAGKDVTIVEMMPHLLDRTMDEEFCIAVEDELKKLGAKVLTGVKINSVNGGTRVKSVSLSNGETLDADMVVFSIGYKPNYHIAERLGLEIKDGYGIIVDEFMRTSNRDIFAVGDCVAKQHYLTGTPTGVMLASTAMAQGRLAGTNLFRLSMTKSFNGTLGSFSSKIGNLAIGVSGITEKEAKELDVHYYIGVCDSMDRHPGKLPGMSKVHLKLLFSKYSHVLIGAQVMGGDSVGELVNMLSVMIQKKMTDMEIDTLQIGTHPLLTASPIAYPVINATVNGIMKWYKSE